MLADLDSAFKDQFLETPAGAALPGSTAWLKDMAPSNAVWDKLVLERHIIASEVGEAAAAVSDAKNHSSATATAEATNVRQEPNYPHGRPGRLYYNARDAVKRASHHKARVEAVLRAGRPRLRLPPPPAWQGKDRSPCLTGSAQLR